jgi:hypothetical protein
MRKFIEKYYKTVLIIGTIFLSLLLYFFVYKIASYIVGVLGLIYTICFSKNPFSEKSCDNNNNNLPRLAISTKELNIFMIKDPKYDNVQICFFGLADILDMSYEEIKSNQTWLRLQNVVTLIELKNVNANSSLLDLSITIDGKEHLKNITLMPGESYGFILGFNYNFIKNLYPKEKNICISYIYSGTNSDIKYGQNSSAKFYFYESLPYIGFDDPPISKQTTIESKTTT